MIHYTVQPFAAFQINVAATGNRDAYEMLTEICRAKDSSGVPIPKEMRAACSLIISGQYRKPSGRGPKPRSDFGLFFISYLLGRYISDAYGLPKTRGDGMEEISSAILLAVFLLNADLMSSTKIRDYLTHGKHKFSREKSDWIREMMYTGALLGGFRINFPKENIRNITVWNFHADVRAFGLFTPIGRMTAKRIGL